jgi:hypothetical protein
MDHGGVQTFARFLPQSHESRKVQVVSPQERKLHRYSRCWALDCRLAGRIAKRSCKHGTAAEDVLGGRDRKPPVASPLAFCTRILPGPLFPPPRPESRPRLPSHREGSSGRHPPREPSGFRYCEKPPLGRRLWEWHSPVRSGTSQGHARSRHPSARSSSQPQVSVVVCSARGRKDPGRRSARFERWTGAFLSTLPISDPSEISFEEVAPRKHALDSDQLFYGD